MDRTGLLQATRFWLLAARGWLFWLPIAGRFFSLNGVYLVLASSVITY
jgi:hypothetical protein